MKRALALSAMFLLALLAWSAPVRAGEEAPVGKPAPAFELQGTDGKTHKLSDYQGKIVVVVFHSLKCPWAVAYDPVLGKTVTGFAKPKDDKAPEVVFVGINSNKAESLDQIKAASARLPFPILKDPHNKVADAYGARTTPHTYVIDQKGTLRYVGGIEKAPTAPDEVGKSSEQYLGPVLAALVEGKEPPVTKTAAVGCTIKRD
ncbi:MAG: redoxin domain-containing protein [Planctomycetota bacterium]|nr:redoxin domain-containing protein [Planctomycetota bacterium]